MSKLIKFIQTLCSPGFQIMPNKIQDTRVQSCYPSWQKQIKKWLFCSTTHGRDLQADKTTQHSTLQVYEVQAHTQMISQQDLLA